MIDQERIAELEAEVERLRLQIETDTEAAARLYEGYEAQEAELTALRAQDARLRDDALAVDVTLNATRSPIGDYRKAVRGEEGGEGE